MKYKELLNIAVETHIGNQMYSGEIGSSDSSQQEILFYLKYLFMAEKELYEAISPFVYDTWCLRVYSSGDTCDKFDLIDLKGTLFKIKSVSIVFPERSRVEVLPEIPRSEMATLMDLDKQGITLAAMTINKKMGYSVNTGNSITVYSNITPYRTVITWLPYYWSLLNKEDNVSASDALKDKESLTEKNSKANADLNYDQFDKYLDYEVITPEQYHELLFNGLLVYLYRNKPTFQASVKERLAYELWEEGKKKARYISTWNSVLTQEGKNC